MKETTTQILKRIEKKIDTPTCPADKKTYEKHCRILEDIQVTFPQFKDALKDIKEVLKEGAETFKNHERRITVMETEKKTAIGVVAFIGAVLGGIAGWLSKHL